MRSFLLLFSLCCLVGLSSCHKDSFCVQGEGELETRTLIVPEFHGIKSQISANIHLTEGPTQSVSVQAQSRLIDVLETTVENDVWIIKYNSCTNSTMPVDIYITIPYLHTAIMQGSGNITSTNNFETEPVNNLRLEITGSGNITLDAEPQNSYLQITGSGDINYKTHIQNTVQGNINGSGNINVFAKSPSGSKITDHSISITGSGDYNAYDIHTGHGKVAISGSGNCYVYVNNNLEANISGSGNVYFRGAPAVLTSVISGSGKVIDDN